MSDASHIVNSINRINTTRLSVPPNHPCFPGHFPGQPILPGVLLLERVMTFAQARLTQPLDEATIYNVKFLASVLPGDQLDMRLTSTNTHEHKFTVHIVKPEVAEYVLACSGQLRIDRP